MKYRSGGEYLRYPTPERWTRVRFLVGSNQKQKKLEFTASLLDLQVINGTVEAPPCVVDMRQLDSEDGKILSLSPGQGNLEDKM